MYKDELNDFKIILYIILFLVFGIIIITCKPISKDYIMTVNGPLSTDKIGLTLEHEHILVDFIGADSTGYERWNREFVVEKVLPYLIEAKEKGVNTFVDCTPSYLGRDPFLLSELSKKSGLNIITNTGYYGARNNLFIPRSFYSSDVFGIAEIWINEFENGIEDSGVKPGFIKIAVDPSDTLSPEHKKLITAAGLTHLKTGLSIASHTGPDKPAFEQIEILKEMGVNPSAFIWVHAQNGSPEGNAAAAKMGVWISLDNIHKGSDIKPGDPYSNDWYAERIVELKKQGLLHKVLISHDAGWYDPGKPEGGSFRGFTDIFDFLLPVLKAKGITETEINQILVRNPAEAFKIKIRLL